MSRADEIIAANDSPDVADLLMEAHGLCRDPVTRGLIELALIHEGKKISKKLRRAGKSA